MRFIFILAALIFAAPATAQTLPSIRILDNSGVEGSRISLQVSLVGTKSTLPTEMTWTAVPGTAKPGIDYEATSGMLVLDPKVSIVGTISVNAIGNSIRDGTRTLQIKITKGVNARCYRCTATVTITDDDTPVALNVRQQCGNGSIISEKQLCPPSGRQGIPDTLGLGVPGTNGPEQGTCASNLLLCTPSKPTSTGIPS